MIIRPSAATDPVKCGRSSPPSSTPTQLGLVVVEQRRALADDVGSGRDQAQAGERTLPGQRRQSRAGGVDQAVILGRSDHGHLRDLAIGIDFLADAAEHHPKHDREQGPEQEQQEGLAEHRRGKVAAGDDECGAQGLG